jgi:glycosyltransferase involved in cell wall biosynthesis
MNLLKELPTPISKETGWPWNEESFLEAFKFEGSSDWPKISIVTPSFNQGRFIEETIRSVLLQNYPNLEYIIIDGGSTDESVEIIEKYAPWIQYWITEKDNGQSHAINKGFKVASGDVIGWINSDDFLLENALFAVANGYAKNPDSIGWVGTCKFTDKIGRVKTEDRPPVFSADLSFAAYGDKPYICQPSCFFSRSAFTNVGMLNEELHYVMDVDLWLRLSRIGEFKSLGKYVACARKYSEIKTHQNPAMRYVERLVVSWKAKEFNLARSQMIEYSIKLGRQHYLNSGFQDMLLLNLAWAYRKSQLKNLISAVKAHLEK